MSSNGGRSLPPKSQRLSASQAASLAGAAQPQTPPQPAPQPQPQFTPSNDLQSTTQAATTLSQIASMNDDQLAQAVIDSKTVDMPNFLNDRPDQTQKFVYQVGLNGAPTVLDQQQFDKFLQDNNIPRAQVMARSVRDNGPYKAQLQVDSFKYSELTYIGGKLGGQASGAGIYFDMNGGHSTGYGGYGSQGTATMLAVYNPKTAKVIDFDVLRRKAASFAKSHPKFARAVGGFTAGQNGNASIYALAMGYNAISGGPVSSTYQNVIDRSAVIVLK